MGKHYVFAVLIAVISCIALILTMFLVTVPQIESLSSDVIPSYSRISTDEYQFVATKHFVEEILSKKYTVDTNDISKFQNNKQYRPGNYDPFTPEQKVEESTNNSSQDKAQENNTNNNSGTVISGTTK